MLGATPRGSSWGLALRARERYFRSFGWENVASRCGVPSRWLRIVAGTVEPDAGEVTLCGVALAHGSAEARRQLGYAPDAAQPLPDLRVEELVALVRALKALPRAISGEVERRWWDRLGLEL